MPEPDTVRRFQKSWDIRRKLINGIMDRGDTLVESLKLIPESQDAMTFERWKRIVSKELEEATKLYGNGEPLLSDNELTTIAMITNPCRGW